MITTLLLIGNFIILIGLVGFLAYHISLNKKFPAKPQEMNCQTFFTLDFIFLSSGISMTISTRRFFYNRLTASGLI